MYIYVDLCLPAGSIVNVDGDQYLSRGPVTTHKGFPYDSLYSPLAVSMGGNTPS